MISVLYKSHKSKRMSVNDAYELLKASCDTDNSMSVKVLYLSNDFKLRDSKEFSSYDPKPIFEIAFRRKAKVIILASYSGDGETGISEKVIGITDRLKRLGKIVGVNVIDHLIINPKGYISMHSCEIFKINYC